MRRLGYSSAEILTAITNFVQNEIPNSMQIEEKSK
jgi:hypothetical protein